MGGHHTKHAELSPKGKDKKYRKSSPRPSPRESPRASPKTSRPPVKYEDDEETANIKNVMIKHVGLSPKDKKDRKSSSPRPSPRVSPRPSPGSSRAPVDYEDDDGTANKDVMISYSAQDRSFMRKLKEALQKRGIRVWVEEMGVKAGFDFLNKVGQAIIDAKCFISLLSVDSVKSKCYQDELALASLYQKPIFPCVLSPEEELVPAMDTHVRMRLARYEWTTFKDESLFEQKVNLLVSNMKAAIGEREEEARVSRASPEHTDAKSKRQLQKRSSRHQIKQKSILPERFAAPKSFWTDSFGHKQKVTWPEFYKAFLEVYREPLTKLYSARDREWLISIIMRKLEVEDPVTDYVTHKACDDFCTVDGECLPFFDRVQEQALESYTIRDVLSMKSSVRINAIENLSKFRSPAVVEALLDLLKDPDNNARAVAAISLARTGETGEKIVNALIDTLSDKDRLVRESGCLALGHLKAKKAVPKILHLWRNDFISHVREAAQAALKQIGGEEAENAIHITKVLSDEIRYLLQE